MQCDECRAQLDALHDEELMPDEAASARAHLTQCADCSRAFEALGRTSHRLQEGLVDYPAPDVLKARIHSALLQEHRTETPGKGTQRRWVSLVAAGVAIAVLSSASTYAAMRRGDSSDSVANEVLTSHVRSLMPGHLTDVASNNQHNVKPWFNGRVDLSPPVPALDSAGFVLVGGRLDYLTGRPVAAVVYSRRQHVINVYSWPDVGGDVPVVTTTSQGYHLARWRKDGVASWAISDLNASELWQFIALYQGR